MATSKSTNNTHGSGEPESRERGDYAEDNDFKAAMSRLERAVQELVGVTAGQLSERATTLIDETSDRIESELRLRRHDPDPEVTSRRARRRERRKHRHDFYERTNDYSAGKGRLYRNHEDERISGVCSGIARYFGLETWVVRMGALTGAVFFPVVVIPAYFVAQFVMGSDPDQPTSDRKRKRKGRRRRSSKNASTQTSDTAYGASRRGKAPEPEYIPRRSLRYTQSDLTQAELRLRRVESFVTSKQYELQKEIAKIEAEEVPR